MNSPGGAVVIGVVLGISVSASLPELASLALGLYSWLVWAITDGGLAQSIMWSMMLTSGLMAASLLLVVRAGRG